MGPLCCMDVELTNSSIILINWLLGLGLVSVLVLIGRRRCICVLIGYLWSICVMIGHLWSIWVLIGHLWSICVMIGCLRCVCVLIGCGLCLSDAGRGSPVPRAGGISAAGVWQSQSDHLTRRCPADLDPEHTAFLHSQHHRPTRDVLLQRHPAATLSHQPAGVRLTNTHTHTHTHTTRLHAHCCLLFQGAAVELVQLHLPARDTSSDLPADPRLSHRCPSIHPSIHSCVHPSIHSPIIPLSSQALPRCAAMLTRATTLSWPPPSWISSSPIWPPSFRWCRRLACQRSEITPSQSADYWSNIESVNDSVVEDYSRFFKSVVLNHGSGRILKGSLWMLVSSMGVNRLRTVKCAPDH